MGNSVYGVATAICDGAVTDDERAGGINTIAAAVTDGAVGDGDGSGGVNTSVAAVTDGAVVEQEVAGGLDAIRRVPTDRAVGKGNWSGRIDANLIAVLDGDVVQGIVRRVNLDACVIGAKAIMGTGIGNGCVSKLGGAGGIEIETVPESSIGRIGVSGHGDRLSRRTKGRKRSVDY